MFTIPYDFQPADQVFVVIDGTRIEAGIVLNISFQVFLDDSLNLITVVLYKILLDDEEEGTFNLDSSVIFETLQEASDFVSAFLTPTPTITPSVTPTISLTPTITPTISLTPTITPTNTVTPSVTPTVTPSASTP